MLRSVQRTEALAKLIYDTLMLYAVDDRAKMCITARYEVNQVDGEDKLCPRIEIEPKDRR
jgi:hypothetical protein